MSTDPPSVDVAWGPNGLADLAPRCDVVVVVDVLRFTTAVDVAVAHGAEVYPYRWHDGSEGAHAARLGADLAVRDARGDDAGRWSLSPSRLTSIPAGTRLVLPSPNGASLAFGARDAGATAVVAGCLRNAPAVGRWLVAHGDRIGIVAAGEKWQGASGPLRPALEDWLGAGALAATVVDHGGSASADAHAAVGSFISLRDRLDWSLAECPSGRLLAERGYSDDVVAASRYGVSDCVPVLVDGRFLDDQRSASRMGE